MGMVTLVNVTANALHYLGATVGKGDCALIFDYIAHESGNNVSSRKNSAGRQTKTFQIGGDLRCRQPQAGLTNSRHSAGTASISHAAVLGIFVVPCIVA